MKRVLSLVLTLVFIISMCGCDGMNEAVDTNLGTKIDAQDIETSADIHIRDKNLLYTQYDNSEIVTMYLTVSSGNEGEGTNHTW